MKYFGIFDERRVCNIELNGRNSILIRILEANGGRKLPIKNIGDYSAILELNIFDYVKNEYEADLEDIFKRLNNFVLENDFDNIIVHCSLGIARSPAIMVYVAKILGNIELENFVKENFRFYNKFIVNAFEKYNYKVKIIDDNCFCYGYSNLNKDNSVDEIIDWECNDFNIGKLAIKKHVLDKK